jgi:hypothetical protein
MDMSIHKPAHTSVVTAIATNHHVFPLSQTRRLFRILWTFSLVSGYAWKIAPPWISFLILSLQLKDRTVFARDFFRMPRVRGDGVVRVDPHYVNPRRPCEQEYEKND